MSEKSRAEQLAALKDKQFDLIVIGGGIIGAGIARDAASRGLQVALFEKEDYASGTSSRSTRLIHGGLRYLEMFDFGLVRMDLKEREILLRIAPHLVRPLAFLVPFYRKSAFYRFKLGVGMWLYDWLSFDKSLPNHKSFSTKKTLQLEPSLRAEGLQGAQMYYDGQVNLPERLTLENIIDAQSKGAQCFNHSRVDSLIRENGRVTGVKVVNELPGEPNQLFEVRGRLVINVSGAWLDGVEQKLLGEKSRKVRQTKGIHFTAPSSVNNAVVLFAEDNRLFFVIPWLGYTWVGTTDTDFDEKLETVRADRDDVEYLLESVKEIFPNSDWETIYFTNAGVRALVRKGGDKDESAVSRKHAIVDHEKAGDAPGLLSVVGGKITGYRGIAEDLVNAATRKLGIKEKSGTALEKLPGGYTGNIKRFTDEIAKDGARWGITPAQAEHLANIYGSRSREILALIEADPELAKPVHPEYPVLRAEIPFAVAKEQCMTLCDFMMRRTDLYFTPDQGRQAAQEVSLRLSELLHWSEERRQQEEAAYAQALVLTQQWRQESASPKAPATAKTEAGKETADKMEPVVGSH
ncbi:MAG TPA: glycerol-3-phosphate dehydrogenase/oxidase [Chloroflexia bacterium]|nr:glycerol-3-phosphate dehydrogenase/oxidase [Chloroflexia bacterium]